MFFGLVYYNEVKSDLWACKEWRKNHYENCIFDQNWFSFEKPFLKLKLNNGIDYNFQYLVVSSCKYSR